MSQNNVSSSDPATVAAASDKPWQFKPGNSAFRAKKLRINAIIAQLSVTYDATGVGGLLIEQAARHLDDVAQSRTREQRKVSSKAANKTLALLKPKPQPPLPSVDELRAKREAARG